MIKKQFLDLLHLISITPEWESSSHNAHEIEALVRDGYVVLEVPVGVTDDRGDAEITPKGAALLSRM